MPGTLLIITILGVLQGLFLALVLFLKLNNQQANRLFAVFVALFSLGLLEPLLEKSDLGMGADLALMFLGNASLLYGPLIFLYVKKLTSRDTFSWKIAWIHGLPFLVFLLVDLVMLFSGGLKSKIVGYELLDLFAFELFVLQILAYHFLAIRELSKHAQAFDQVYASPNSRQLVWLRNLLLILTGIYLCSFMLTHLLVITGMNFSNFLLGLQIAIVLLIYLTSYKAMLQPEVFEFTRGSETSSILRVSPAAPSEKYRKSGLSEEKADYYQTQLLTYLNSEKPYLDTEMNIYHLATRLGITRNLLSQIINEKLGKNFQQLINEYRVEEAKRLLQSPKFRHHTLLAIGLDAGFRSKTTFNQNFKKLTGLTPSAWREKNLNEKVREIHIKDVPKGRIGRKPPS